MRHYMHRLPEPLELTRMRQIQHPDTESSEAQQQRLHHTPLNIRGGPIQGQEGVRAILVLITYWRKKLARCCQFEAQVVAIRRNAVARSPLQNQGIRQRRLDKSQTRRQRQTKNMLCCRPGQKFRYGPISGRSSQRSKPSHPTALGIPPPSNQAESETLKKKKEKGCLVDFAIAGPTSNFF